MTGIIGRRRGIVLAAFAVPVLVAALFVFVFPTGTWWNQRRAIARETERLHLLREQNRELERELRRLQNPAEIERIARERYRMVRPGEQAWIPVPQAPPPVRTPSS